MDEKVTAVQEHEGLVSLCRAGFAGGLVCVEIGLTLERSWVMREKCRRSGSHG